MHYQFRNRIEAGRKLSESLLAYKGRKDTLILALPRGGVPIAFEIAKALSLPLDVLLVRKLGVPGHEELAMGAIAWGDICYINQSIAKYLDTPKDTLNRIIEKERNELLLRNELYRNNSTPPKIKGKTIIVVDDGIATGSTMRVAIAALQQAEARRIVVAVPVGSSLACKELESEADEVVCGYTPEPFYGVGRWYYDFSQVSSEEVVNILKTSSEHFKNTKIGLS
jgi:predicted phosphoribosyltransferase